MSNISIDVRKKLTGKMLDQLVRDDDKHKKRYPGYLQPRPSEAFRDGWDRMFNNSLSAHQKLPVSPNEGEK